MNYQLAKVEKVWLDNPMIQKILKTDDIFNLGWRFAALPELTTAESMFELLTQKQHHKVSLSSYARKLASAHDVKGNHSKKRYYDQLADSLLLEN